MKGHRILAGVLTMGLLLILTIAPWLVVVRKLANSLIGGTGYYH